MDLTGLKGEVLEMSEASQGEITQVQTLELGVAVKVYSSPLLSSRLDVLPHGGLVSASFVRCHIQHPLSF